MAVYLKKFENHTQYDTYTASTEFITPNVSLCTTEDDVHYNSYVPPTPTETRLVAKYYVESEGSTITLFNSQGGSGSGSGSDSEGEPPFSSMEIDGDEQSEVVNEYTFDTVGEHIVKYTLIDPTSIGNQTFQNCNNLTSIDIPSGVTTIGDSAFAYCSSLTSCTIGNGVTSIGNVAFQDCYGLTSIVIPNSVTRIDSGAFYNCDNLTSIVCNATTAPTIQNTTFQNVHTGGTLKVPSGSTGYDVWMGTGNYYLGLYNWTKVEQ